MVVEAQQKATVPPCVSLASMWIQPIRHAPIAHQVTFKRSKTKAHAYNVTQACFRARVRNRTAPIVPPARSQIRALLMVRAHVLHVRQAHMQQHRTWQHAAHATSASIKMVQALPSAWRVHQGSYPGRRMQRFAWSATLGITAVRGQVSAWHARRGRCRRARDKEGATSVREHQTSTRTRRGAQHARRVLLVLPDLVRAAGHRPKATASTVHQGGSATLQVVFTVPTAIFSRRRML